VPAHNVQSTFGRKFFAPFGHEADGVRLQLASEAHHLICRSHFEVQWQLDFGHQALYIIVHDVTPILSQVDGKTVRAGCRDQSSDDNRIGMLTAPCISNGGHVINVHAKS
jgi:hypothetical protein